MKENKDDKWLLNKIEEYQSRYIKAETLLSNIYCMPWYKRLFCGFMIEKYVKEMKNNF